MPEIEQELRALVQTRAELDEMDGEIHRRREEAQQVAVTARYLEEANAALRQEMEGTRKKFDMLEQDDPVCPLCKQPLGAEGPDHLRREYEAQGLETKRNFRENETEHEALDQRQRELSTGLSQLEADLGRGRRQLESMAANLERDKAEAEKAQTGLPLLRTRLEEADTLLKTEAYAREERAGLAGLDAELSALGYDPEGHRQVQGRVKELNAYDELHRKLLEAVEGLPAERKALEASKEMLGRRRRDFQEAEQRRAALETEVKTLPGLEERLREATTRLKGLEAQREQARINRGVLKEQIKRCGELEAEVGQREAESHGLLDDKSVYDELAVAFGKNGIQALIIETAIPQLMADANELLGRLTENRMSLKLELHEGKKDRRTGLPSEELGISIARRGGHAQLRDLQRGRGLPDQLRTAYRPLKASGPKVRRAPAHPLHRRRVWLPG